MSQPHSTVHYATQRRQPTPWFQFSSSLLRQVVPADVRHGKAEGGVEARNHAGDKPEPLAPAVLLAAIKQQLQAQADAQERLVRLCFEDDSSMSEGRRAAEKTCPGAPACQYDLRRRYTNTLLTCT